MENENKNRVPETVESAKAPEEKKFILQPGERVFAVVLLVLEIGRAHV